MPRSQLIVRVDAANVRRELNKQPRDNLRFDDWKTCLFEQSKGLFGAMRGTSQTVVDETVASVERSEVDSSGADASALRKRWVAATKRVHSLSQRSGRADRPSVLEAQTALEEAAVLPDPRTFLAGDTVASYESSLSALLARLLSTREWVAEVRDLIGSPLSTATPQQLKSLLSEADGLPLVAAAEEGHLRRLLREADGLRVEALAALRDDSAASEKVDLEAAEAVVQRAQLLRVSVDAVGRLKTLCEEARALSLRSLLVLERARSMRLSKRSKLEIETIPLDDIERLMAECESCTLVVPFAEELRAMIAAVQSWRAEVREITEDNSKVVSLQRLEQLLGDADGFPVDLSQEIATLKEKREVARGWLEKLKKVLPNKGRQPLRKMDAEDYSENRVNLNDMKNLVAQSEQVLHRESEEDRTSREIAQSSRELNKAQTLVDVAEGWASRVRELLGESDLSSIDSLEDLLREAESMPVYMEEMSMLRVHLDTCAWSKKVRKKLEAGKLRPADLQRSVKDLAKIRSVLPNKETLSQLVTFPEEAMCTEALAFADRWIARSKRLIPGGKRDIDYAKLRQLYLDGLHAPVNLDSELRPLFQYISDAESWVDQHRGILMDVGIACTMGKTDPNEGDVDDRDNRPADVVNTVESKMQMEKVEGMGMNTVSLLDLERLNESANHLVVIFPELQELRSRIDQVRRWLEEVNNLYPRKTMNSNKKRSKVRRTDANYLDELLARGKSLGIDISDDIERVSEIVEYSKNYNATCIHVLKTIGNKVEVLEKLCVKMIQSKSTVFPFLEGVRDSKGIIVEDQETAAMLNTVNNELNDLVRKGEDSVLSSNEARLVDLCAGIMKWVQHCRNFLLRKDWGNIDVEEIGYLYGDITSVLTSSW